MKLEASAMPRDIHAVISFFTEWNAFVKNCLQKEFWAAIVLDFTRIINCTWKINLTIFRKYFVQN